MQITSNAKYRFSNRFQGKHRLELFNDHYLSVRSKTGLHDANYRLEVATLLPEGKRIERPAWFWLATTLLILAVSVFLGFTFIVNPEAIDLRIAVGSIAVLLLLAGYSFAVFRRKSELLWVFETRSARYPLINIPYDRKCSDQATFFVVQLEKAIKQTTEQKQYNQDDLFAGEMRMLRRLAKSGVLSEDMYDTAKKNMLGDHQMVTATQNS
jgi:hypothetical protein